MGPTIPLRPRIQSTLDSNITFKTGHKFAVRAVVGYPLLSRGTPSVTHVLAKKRYNTPIVARFYVHK